jgi:RNA polymerase subunit RPABC4/transcription elongation factor Spt4
MQFGRCTECNEYKYLKEENTCPTCLEKEANWAVYRVIVLSRPQLVEKGLSKEEAKSRAENKQYLFASKVGKVNDF